MPAYLTSEQPGAGDRHDQQVAQGADVGLAGDGVARDHRHREREEQRELDDEGGERDEQAVLGDRAEEVRAIAAARRCRRGRLTEDRDR